MTPDIQQIVASVHDAGRQMVIATTGGGAGAIAWLTGVPGASRSVLEAHVPYSQAALADWLGGPPDSSCSASTSRRMAMAAWQRATELVGERRAGLIGIGATAALVSDRPKRGNHRVYASWQTETTTGTVYLRLAKNQRDRDAEEDIAARLIIEAVSMALDLESPSLELTAGDSFRRRRWNARAEWTELLLAQRDWFAHSPETANDAPRLLIPGSFNPLHEGHRQLAQTATQLTGRPAVFELSMTNVEKPMLDFIELRSRLLQFKSEQIVVTAAPKFVEKARLFPGVVFAVGVDTIARIAEAKFYEQGEPGRVAAMREISGLGCRFLVFGRGLDGQFVGLEDIPLPDDLRALCKGVDEQQFRIDVSSTELRERNGK